MSEKRIVRSKAEMIAAGRELAARLRGGDVVAMDGEMGAGKTHLCKGLVAGLGSDADVTSPTFALVQEYPGGRVPVFHFDFYRIEHPFELEEIGWDDYLDRGGVVLVEWASKFPRELPADRLSIEVRISDRDERELILT